MFRGKEANMLLKEKIELAKQMEEDHKVLICFHESSNVTENDVVNNCIWIQLTNDAVILGVRNLLAEYGYEIDYDHAPVNGGFYTADMNLDNGLYLNLRPLTQITREMIHEGLYGPTHDIKLVSSPRYGYGTVANIGIHTVVFGGRKARDLNPVDYTDQTTSAEVVEELYKALEGIKEENKEAYRYCYLCLL